MGEYSGPSSKPEEEVSSVSLVSRISMAYILKSLSLLPVNTRVFPSGDQPCQKDGAFLVTKFGSPPVTGIVYIFEVSQFSSGISVSVGGSEALIAICVPSGENP